MKNCKTCNIKIPNKKVYCSRPCKRKAEWQRTRTARNNSDNPMKPHGGNHTGKTGKDHYAYKDGNGLFTMKLAKTYKLKVRYCEHCNKDLLDVKPALYAVHHIDHNRSNNEETNFQLLCKRCHQLEHKCWENLPN